jgi:hypothetical protein
MSFNCSWSRGPIQSELTAILGDELYLISVPVAPGPPKAFHRAKRHAGCRPEPLRHLRSAVVRDLAAYRDSKTRVESGAAAVGDSPFCCLLGLGQPSMSGQAQQGPLQFRSPLPSLIRPYCFLS